MHSDSVLQFFPHFFSPFDVPNMLLTMSSAEKRESKRKLVLISHGNKIAENMFKKMGEQTIG
jgi:hypothetical protein